MPPSLILASTSRYRRELLSRLGLRFQVQAPDVDETAAPGEPAEVLARRLALAKALAVARAHPAAVVVGSDQVCCVGGQVLGKPGSTQRARAQLRALSGQEAVFLTAVAVAWDGGERTAGALDRTRVRFRHLDDDTIGAYVDRDRPVDCAGSFRSEGLGIALLESLRTEDPTALVGLPLIRLCTLLGQAGLAVLPGTRAGSSGG